MRAYAYRYSYYTGRDSTWVSSTLRDDGPGYTSYDYTYRNSYSYCSSCTHSVQQWDYAYDRWVPRYTQYDGGDSRWYSSTLRDDGPGYTSYDYTYRNSYSYSTYSRNVYKWDYAYNNWNFTTTTMGGFLAQDGQVQMSASDSPVLMAGLGCAALTIIGVAANKYKKAKAKSDDFVFESTAVDKVQIA